MCINRLCTSALKKFLNAGKKEPIIMLLGKSENYPKTAKLLGKLRT